LVANVSEFNLQRDFSSFKRGLITMSFSETCS
jgi:hypothetical protein